MRLGEAWARPGEAWARPRLERKTYWHKDKARLMGTRNYIILQSRSLSGRHVSTSFLDPVLGAMMKQVCWHSRRIKAHRGLPEARGQSEAHGDSNPYIQGDPKLRPFARRARGPTWGHSSSFPSPHPQDQGCVMVLSVRSSQQDIVVNLDSGGCGGFNMWPGFTGPRDVCV